MASLLKFKQEIINIKKVSYGKLEEPNGIIDDSALVISEEVDILRICMFLILLSMLFTYQN